jgi:hypothetical protein
MAEQLRDVYMNRVQQRIFLAGARDVRLLAARRFGKTDGCIGPRIWAVADSMPQGAGAFLGSSRKQLFSRTIPATIAAIERFYGFKEGVHFGWGKPPKDVPKCIIRPKSYDNCMWFATGFLYHTISLATMGSANGLTLNTIIADECKFLPKKKIDEEVMPALSGIVHPTGHDGFTEANPFYKSTFFCSDAGLTSKSNWLAGEEEVLKTVIDHGPCEGMTYLQVQQELDHYADLSMKINETIRTGQKLGIRPIQVSQQEKDFITDLWAAIQQREEQFRILPPQYKDPKAIAEYLLNYKVINADTAELLTAKDLLITDDEMYEMMAIKGSKKYQKRINDLKCNAFYFVRASSIDNIDILGEDYIRRMKRDLPPLTFMVSVLNLKLGKVGEGFYYAFDPDVHCYLDDGNTTAIEDSMKVKRGKQIVGGTAYGIEYESPDFDYLSDVNDCSLDGDCLDDEDLHIAFDAGKIVNWIVTGMVYRRPEETTESLNVISSMFAKDGRMVQHLIKDWSDYYAPHRKKNRRVHFYYDHTFKFKPTGVYIDDIKDTIIKELKKYGWDVNPIPIGQTWAHHVRYKDIGEGMSGLSYPAVRFNKANNEALCAAIENCGVRMAYSGATTTVKKDKAGEKLATDSERATAGAEPEELRTDGTDAFDTLYIGVRHYRQSTSLLMTPSGR